MPGGDEVPVRLDETPHVLTVHGERKRLVERTLYRRIRPPQNAERDPCALRGGFVFVHHPQLARKAEFQREAADNPHQKAIQGSDLREVLRRDHLAEKRRVLRILLGAFGQQRHKPLEDLARRRTRERERDDFLRLHLTTDQVYEPLRQRLRLAGPRRRLDQYVRDHLCHCSFTTISANRPHAVLRKLLVASHDHKVSDEGGGDDDSIRGISIVIGQLRRPNHDIIGRRNDRKTVHLRQVGEKPIGSIGNDDPALLLQTRDFPRRDRGVVQIGRQGDAPASLLAQFTAAHAEPNERTCVQKVIHQAFSHSAESSAKRSPLTAIFVP